MASEKEPKLKQKKSKIYYVKKNIDAKDLYGKFDKQKQSKKLTKAAKEEKENDKAEKVREEELLASMDQSELGKRFLGLGEKLRRGVVWTEVDVAGEKHNLPLTQLLHKGKEVRFEKLVEELENVDKSLKSISTTFSITKIHGRENYLELHFTIPVISLLKGGGSIEEKLQKLITEQYAGTTERYKKLKEVEDGEMPVAPIYLFPGDSSVREAQRELINKKQVLVKGDHELVERVIQAKQLHNQPHQITVSTTDSAEWYAEVAQLDQKGNPITQLLPQEIATKSTSKSAKEA